MQCWILRFPSVNVILLFRLYLLQKVVFKEWKSSQCIHKWQWSTSSYRKRTATQRKKNTLTIYCNTLESVNCLVGKQKWTKIIQTIYKKMCLAKIKLNFFVASHILLKIQISTIFNIISVRFCSCAVLIYKM